MNLKPIAKAVRFSLVLIGTVTTTVLSSGMRSLSVSPQSAELTTSDRSSPVNIRERPSTLANIAHLGYAGDRVKVLDQDRGRDGFSWYQVQFERSGAVGWVRGDLVRIFDPGAEPGPVIVQSRVTTGSRVLPRTNTASPVVLPPETDFSPQAGAIQPKATPVARIESTPTNFTKAQLDYFMEIAMGSEYGGEANPQIHKWSGDIRVQYFGNPTAEDLRTLKTVISEINALTNGAIRMQLVGSCGVAPCANRNANITLYFVPESQFRRYEPGYVPVNYGFFMTNWDATGRITRANVLITTTGVTQRERSHLLREELTQSLGLMRDSYRYADSMFYQPWTDVTQYSEIDKALIRMLYSSNIRPGMTKAEVMNALTLQAQGRQPLRF